LLFKLKIMKVELDFFAVSTVVVLVMSPVPWLPQEP
jgi:hypothetical protein